MMIIEDAKILAPLIDSYMNGNFTQVKIEMFEQGYTVAQMLEFYYYYSEPSKEDVILFVERLEEAQSLLRYEELLLLLKEK